ncbi:hypothetical protein K438DRAFT_1978485 [Mycena galopus ATCC 62051]|nr:hypothetical protein K438DRAFT_1978485 [Mycena galopus ATCC 62051]
MSSLFGAPAVPAAEMCMSVQACCLAWPQSQSFEHPITLLDAQHRALGPPTALRTCAGSRDRRAIHIGRWSHIDIREWKHTWGWGRSGGDECECDYGPSAAAAAADVRCAGTGGDGERD